MILNLYKHRGYILRTALADLRNRYAGSGMGVIWNVLQPLALITVFSLVFTKIMVSRGAPDAPVWQYPLYLCSGLLPWLGFSEALTRGTHSFVENAVYLRKLAIPEQVFSAQAALSAAFGLAISFSLLLVFALALGHPPTWHWLLLPFPLITLIGFGFGLGMLLGVVNAFIRDVGQIVPIVMQIGFWSFPICYDPQFLPKWMQTAVRFNPVYPYLTTIRDLFLEGKLPFPTLWLEMVLWAVAASAAGYLVLRKLRPELRDVL